MKWKVVYEEVSSDNKLVRRTKVYDGKDVAEVRTKVVAELKKEGAYALVRTITELKSDVG